MQTADHNEHVLLFFDLWLSMARAQLEAMRVLWGEEPCGAHADTIRMLEGQIDLVESKLRTVQNGDGLITQQQNTRGGDDGG